MGKNILVAHGGGPTAVINTSLQGVIETARINGGFNKILGAKFGAEGILKNDLLDLTNIPSSTVGKLSHTPATAIGSCRRKLSDKDYPAVIECMKKNDIGVFFYNGGNDSMDTCNKISILAEKEGLDLQVIGIPKTMDNDLAFTDNCPGFGSAARYAAINASELALDANGLPIHVVVLELMGRNAGWVTAASALAARVTNCEVLTYLPEKLVDVNVMLSDIEKAYAKERALAIADEWGKAMKSSEVRDFIAVGDVDIKAIGADNQILDSEVPVRQMLEQIVAKLSLPPFMLGLSWSTTERMSQQQADSLTTELESYRRILTPVIKRICKMHLRAYGYTKGVDVIWNDITLKDMLDEANARYLNAKADEIYGRIGEEKEERHEQKL